MQTDARGHRAVCLMHGGLRREGWFKVLGLLLCLLQELISPPRPALG